MNYIKESDVEKVFINGTKTARGFYQAMGFKPIAEKVVDVRGAQIEIFYMEMDLNEIK